MARARARNYIKNRSSECAGRGVGEVSKLIEAKTLISGRYGKVARRASERYTLSCRPSPSSASRTLISLARRSPRRLLQLLGAEPCCRWNPWAILDLREIAGDYFARLLYAPLPPRPGCCWCSLGCFVLGILGMLRKWILSVTGGNMNKAQKIDTMILWFGGNKWSETLKLCFMNKLRLYVF